MPGNRTIHRGFRHRIKGMRPTITQSQSQRFRNTAGTAAVLLLVLAGCGSPDTGSGDEAGGNAAPKSSASAPATPNPESSSSNTTEAKQAQKATPAEVGMAMEPSQPVGFSIPALDRQDDIIKTGLREDNSLEVPPEHEGAPASWYEGSPTPGEIGPAVLLGHVNSLADESGVFYDLESMVEGDTITVDRADGSTAVFEVYESEIYPKNEFPTKAVYQPTEGAELRLITCDGFTESSGEFVENLVVYAKLVDVR